MKQLTFDNVCKQLNKNKDFNEMLDGLGALSGATILLLGLKGVSGNISAFLNALTIKDQLINIGKCILNKILEGKTNEYDKRINQMQWAYSIIYYTAFFDVLDEQMPEETRKKIGLSLGEKESIFQNADFRKMEKEDSLIDAEIFYPNIVHGYANIEAHLENLYKLMCEGLKKFVHMLSFEETSSEKSILEFNDFVKNLPKSAIERFKSQYLYLASNFNEFYIYMEIEEEKIKMIHVEELYKNIISIGYDTNKKIDVGLEYLENIMLNLPEKIHEDKVKNIVSSLIEKYKGDIEKPIIDSKSNDEKLKYPSICKAFIPQSYKILEYSGAERLEKVETWINQKECNYMNSFWAKYYISHYSLENLLLILGEPGGGKSLLTKILCARMSDSNNIFVRIPLREVSVEKEIEDIVCEQIQKDGDASEPLPTYKWFAENFKYNPITLVFDGYDEVLQATGGVYRNFLKKILKFQEQCSERHRPVRIVVTSRETLIDKADIPTGTVVLKLLEFNEEQREQWIEIWNQNNDEIFKKEHINSFMLPKNNSSIDELSKQPLLLLMLAIYDANIEEGINCLGREENLNRTKLYNELLRRFIRRELKKGPRGDEVSYEESTEKDKEIMINLEMEKLGIAALGMFIRGKLSLKVSEMERDLVYMESQTPTYKSVGKMLSIAEEFFGSFFFIHDSQSGNAETEDKEVAFEFLHKTFYEFLVADLVLKYLIGAIDELDALKTSKRCDSYRKAIDDPDHFEKQYYTALMSAYICAEPEIIEMIVEWKESVINDYFQGERAHYDDIIEELFNKQIEMLCDNIFMPKVWNDQSYDNVSKKSYMQYCAIYFMNLLILQIITKKDSKRIIKKQDWIYISQFWKMNIQEDVLLKFISLFRITNEQEGVCIKKKQLLGKVEQKNLLEKQKDIFNFLQDVITYNLYCLHDVEVQHGKKQKYRSNLLNKGINIEFELILGELNEYILGNNSRFSLMENVENGIHILSKTLADASMVLDWLLCINNCLDKITYPFGRNKDVADELIDLVLHDYPDNTQIVSEAFKFCQKIGVNGVLRRNNIFLRNFPKIIYDNPQQSIEYISLYVQYLPIEETKKLISYLQDWFCRIGFKSLDVVTVMLKLYIMIDAEPEFNQLLDYIKANVGKFYDALPKYIIEILRLCILQGRIDVACHLIDFEDIEKNILFYDQPELIIDYLEVISILVGVGQKQYIEEIMRHIYKKFEHIFYRNPRMALRIFKIVLLFEDKNRCNDLIFKLYKQYDILFEEDPKEAIIFLKMTNKFIEKKELKRALKYSIDRFCYVVEKSLVAAIDLLILCKRSIPNICSYIQRCFDYILCDNIFVDSNQIFELLDGLEDRELDRMVDFFGKRYLYIIIYFPNLAKIIAKIYCKSTRKQIFLDILWSYKHNYIVDEEYILYLDKLWKK